MTGLSENGFREQDKAVWLPYGNNELEKQEILSSVVEFIEKPNVTHRLVQRVNELSLKEIDGEYTAIPDMDNFFDAIWKTPCSRTIWSDSMQSAARLMTTQKRCVGRSSLKRSRKRSSKRLKKKKASRRVRSDQRTTEEYMSCLGDGIERASGHHLDCWRR